MNVRKQREYDLAFHYYTKDGLTAKAISEKITISENTLTGKKGWIKKFEWERIRNANYSTSKKTLQDLEHLKSILIERRLEQERNTEKEVDKALIYEIRALSKEIERYTKDTHSLTTYIDIVDELLDHIQRTNIELHTQLASTIKQFINDKAKKY